MRARRVDGNHAAIRDGLRAVGIIVHDTHDLGDGFPDLTAKGVGAKYDQIVLLEVKDGSLPPSKRALTDDEVRFHGNWRGVPLFVVETLEEALVAVGAR